VKGKRVRHKKRNSEEGPLKANSYIISPYPQEQRINKIFGMNETAPPLSPLCASLESELYLRH